MVRITKDEVQHLAQLSSLQLDDSEILKLQDDIEKILDYISELNELDTTDVVPTYQVGGNSNVWREDKVALSNLSREELLQLAPAQKDNQIRVPKVISR